MNISDRIQSLRKAKGISQEQLADILGVSRQAVSKWESEQSTPDIDKIISMSEYFEVTTDYILKGIEQTSVGNKEKSDAKIFAIAATAFNAMGLIVATAIWYENQIAAATAIGLILMIMGCMIYGVGMCTSRENTKKAAKKLFLTINIWVLSFIPLSLIYNALAGGYDFAPYPTLTSSYIKYILFWVVYLSLGIIIELFIYKKKQD